MIPTAIAYKNNMESDNTTPDALRQNLVDLARYRDKQLFVRLYDYFAPRLKNHLIRKGAHSEMAEELVQEAMLSVWRHCGSYNPDKATASTWIFRITRNLWIDRMRKDKPGFIVPMEVYPDFGFEPSYASADSDKLRQAINSLPNQQSQLVYKVYFEGKSHREIADDMDIPLGSVKSGLRLAFDKLRKQIGHADLSTGGES
ncbi:sigma-70 family RNA polymerase sigma factor [Endozoicomonas montiporae]|uniref:RNA polymerase sigma factor n=2 Tax=Endozoicomonas montiporae TaxID=1027273 RepID=A0A142BG47_9GAMM|nr:sigma-70 family RNA polymerase sigma factor [Endozoicomonas montiporae]AMO57723.1 RNA polymerase sigma factor RpoE [Endozoicomonas montiporae CL-33]